MVMATSKSTQSIIANQSYNPSLIYFELDIESKVQTNLLNKGESRSLLRIYETHLQLGKDQSSFRIKCQMKSFFYLREIVMRKRDQLL